jgi:phospholipid transport system substrate-binding protein
MNSTNRLLATLLLFLLMGTPVAASADDSAQTPGAAATIDVLHGQFLEVMKQAEAIGFDGRYDRLHEIVGSSFDLDFMAEKSVGRHWKKLTPEEQQRWLASFQDMTAATYAGRFEGFSGQHFEVLGEEPAKRDTVLVRGLLVDPAGEDVHLHYRMHQQDGQWRIIDVYLNGTVSELALRRSEYASVLRRDGFEKLIAMVEGKTQELAQASIN